MMAQGRKPWKDKGAVDTRSAMLILEEHLAERDPSFYVLPEPPEPEPAPQRPSASDGRRARRRAQRERRRRRR